MKNIFVKELNLRDHVKMKHSVAKTYDLDSSKFTMQNNFNFEFDMIQNVYLLVLSASLVSISTLYVLAPLNEKMLQIE